MKYLFLLCLILGIALTQGAPAPGNFICIVAFFLFLFLGNETISLTKCLTKELKLYIMSQVLHSFNNIYSRSKKRAKIYTMYLSTKSLKETQETRFLKSCQVIKCQRSAIVCFYQDPFQ